MLNRRKRLEEKRKKEVMKNMARADKRKAWLDKLAE